MNNYQVGDKDKVLGTVIGFLKENKNRPIWSRTEEIKVKIIDWSKYLEIIKNSHDGLKDVSLQILSGNGIVYHGSDKSNDDSHKPILIDDECCGVDSVHKNILSDSDKKMLSGIFFDGIGIFDKKKNSIPVIPKFYVMVDFDDIKNCFTGEEKELWKYMDERYEYNSRISSNMHKIVSLVNKQNT